ncbi:MAG TPA: MgtC/SapB family protein [Lacipirellulaceae bacterium]|nr:MgtC/SapB family protein [Lacipirellulaceae bacterium]HMP04860.1 MgtC/SapB family protein [Lacipirellulaceae bacterium]
MPVWEQITGTLAQDFGDLADAAAATRVTARLLLAAAIGGVLGLERESTGKSAGVRTHMLVALGSALFVLIPVEQGADEQAVSRVAQGVVAGIGFLGAGAIMKDRSSRDVHGLTTAAGIWTTAALGMTAGMGRGATAVLATLLALAILSVLPGSGPHRRPPALDR